MNLADRFGYKEISYVLLFPALLGVLLWYIHPPFDYRTETAPVDLISVINFIIFVDLFHIFTTFWYTLGNVKLFNRIKKLLCLAIVSVLTFNFAVAGFFGLQVLLRVVAYWVLIHTVLQQFAWLQKSFDFKLDLNSYRAYKMLFLSCALLPIIVWHTGAGNFSNFYTYRNTIVYVLPEEWANILMATSIFLIVASLTYLGFRRNLMIKPTILIFFTWLIYYVGIIITNSFVLFMCLLVMTHAIGYIIYSVVFSPNGKVRLKQTPAWLNSIPGQLAIILILSLGWKILSQRDFFDIAGAKNLTMLVPLKILPTVLHLAIDTFIWRESIVGNLEQN